VGRAVFGRGDFVVFLCGGCFVDFGGFVLTSGVCWGR
jgi:hypothetical protein